MPALLWWVGVAAGVVIFKAIVSILVFDVLGNVDFVSWRLCMEMVDFFVVVSWVLLGRCMCVDVERRWTSSKRVSWVLC